MKMAATILILCCSITINAQDTFTIRVTDNNKRPLHGASVTWKEGNSLNVSDSTGSAMFSRIRPGRQTFNLTFVGYQDTTIQLQFPFPDSVILITLNAEEPEDEEEVVVTATRTSGTITNAPTRIEVISGEEMDEKVNMVPGDIRMVLNESTGIQTQQTSATSYNSSIRIQGLDGRYTQILRDGYPLYAGFSGGLSIMQIAPLDLKQVEVIKGSSSTLYGGGAIAGLVNLVSKTPGYNRDLSFMGNVTSAGGLDLSAFYGKRSDKFGLTVFAARNSAKPFDPADIGLTAIPKFERYTLNPRLFIYHGKTTFDIGGSFIKENRTGGSVEYIKQGTSGFFEKNNTKRYTSLFGLRHTINDNSFISLKNSVSLFNRHIEIPTYRFAGEHISTFSELTLNLKNQHTHWVGGLNFITDDFEEERLSSDVARDYHINTFGAFIQNSWSPVEFFTMESGLRSDYANEYGWELLPRASLLFRFSPKLSSRIGAGFGYKTPTVFNEEAERIQFRNILPIDKQQIENEKSVGGNFDVNYRSQLGNVRLTINQLFFYTKLNKPLVLVNNSQTTNQFVNAHGHFDSKGLETNIGLTFKAIKLYFGYTYTDVNTHFDGIKEWFPLTSRHRLNYTLVYEKENFLKAGLEAYYNSPQKLSDGTSGRDYWMLGFMLEKIWKKVSVFINFENFTDARQTRFDTIYTGTLQDPVFRDIYAPVDGFVINGGFKLRI